MRLTDIVCFSQLRWNFVFQRPHHLMTRAARGRRVFYVEEPRQTQRTRPYIRAVRAHGVLVCTPYVTRASQRPARWGAPAGRRLAPGQEAARMRHNDAVVASLVDDLLRRHGVVRPVVWCSTPMLEPVAREIDAAARVYDCMDELAAFRRAPPGVAEREDALLRSVDLVFTGGYSLYEAKRRRHPRVFNFPSAVDAAHFAPARAGLPEPADLAGIGRPRLGFVGVVDERLDARLLGDLAEARPDWQWILVGPVAKIRRRALPHAANVHYLGRRSYGELAAYLGQFDAAIMPFAMNSATRYISPTKTLEYLAAGLPVVSTPIVDVVRTFASRGLVEIGGDVAEFIAACERALAAPRDARRAEADDLAARTSWDATWARMERLIAQATALRALRGADDRRGRAAKRAAGRPAVAIPIRGGSAMAVSTADGRRSAAVTRTARPRLARRAE